MNAFPLLSMKRCTTVSNASWWMMWSFML